MKARAQKANTLRPRVNVIVRRARKPVAGAVTSAFGWRRHPITQEVKFHQGVDLRAAYGLAGNGVTDDAPVVHRPGTAEDHCRRL